MIVYAQRMARKACFASDSNSHLLFCSFLFRFRVTRKHSHRRRNVDCIFWVDEARKILGFDGPDYKDRFATARRFNQIHAAKIAAATNTVGAPEAPPAAATAAATSAASTTGAHVGSIPSGLETKAADLDRGGVPAAGTGGKKRKSSSSSSSISSSSGGLRGNGSGEDPQKEKKKKKRKKKRVPEPDDGLIHYSDLLRKYPVKNAFSSSTNAAGSLSERLPTTTHNQQPHPSASASSSSSSSSSKPKTIHTAPWIHAKVIESLQGS